MNDFHGHPAQKPRRGALSVRVMFFGLLAATVTGISVGLDCGAQAAPKPAQSQSAQSQPGRPRLQLTSTSIPGGTIPARYTCDGQNLSPELAWSTPPAATQSLALVVTDPDAPSGNFVHWLLWDLPTPTRHLPEGLSKAPGLPNGARQGSNDFGNTGYSGPCPPPGKTHRYVFTVYALDSKLNLPAAATRAQVAAAIQKHLVAQGEFTSRYGRR